jgi:hypothetical protein
VEAKSAFVVASPGEMVIHALGHDSVRRFFHCFDV